jgi:hypothetical protein
VKHRTIVKSSKNCIICNVLDGTENEERESLDSNGDNSAGDFWGFCDRK